MDEKIRTEHTQRQAWIYVRQSTAGQVRDHKESRRVQYGLVQRARDLGWSESEILVVDEDLGISAAGCNDRPGFEGLLRSVCENLIGGVFTVEASRLARNGREWHTLLELCGVTRTVLVDLEAVYDPNLFNDRLLLGLKGEISEMELRVLRERSQLALREKAKRGELYLMLPAGYVVVGKELRKDPDRRVQETIELVFRKFRELGSMRQVFKWFMQQNLQLPRVDYTEAGPRIVWTSPNSARLGTILKHPVYAGAYTFGRTKTVIELRDGKKVRKKGIRKEQSEWDVLIFDHHEGYITWDELQNNLNTIAQNTNMKRPVVKGSPGGGDALLGGMLRCGHCGRRLNVKYQGRNAEVKRYQCVDRPENVCGKRCIAFGGHRVDKAVSNLLLETVSPMGLQAALKAIEQLESQSLDTRRQYELALEEARYEAGLARRRFDAVDPENRLVASTLETEWNQALLKVAEVEKKLQTHEQRVQPLSDCEREWIMALADDLPFVWHHPSSDPEIKKRILRTVIKEVVAYLDGQTIKLLVHWYGGDHTELCVQKNKSGETRWTTKRTTVRIIEHLARIMPDNHIVMCLNRLGKRTAKGNTWTPARIRTFRRDHGIPVYKEGERQDRSELTVEEASEVLGIGKTKLWRLIEQKILPAKRACPGAPWIIAENDLDHSDVRAAAASRLRKRPFAYDSNQETLDLQ